MISTIRGGGDTVDAHLPPFSSLFLHQGCNKKARPQGLKKTSNVSTIRSYVLPEQVVPQVLACWAPCAS